MLTGLLGPYGFVGTGHQLRVEVADIPLTLYDSALFGEQPQEAGQEQEKRKKGQPVARLALVLEFRDADQRLVS
jgi:hypothetical protein